MSSSRLRGAAPPLASPGADAGLAIPTPRSGYAPPAGADAGGPLPNRVQPREESDLRHRFNTARRIL